MDSNGSERMSGRIRSFLIAFLVGTAAMLLLREVLPGPPWAGALCAALVACAAIVVLGARYYRSHSPGDLDRAGDNLYYLGFLFTLISLIHALINLFFFEERGTDLAERTYTLIGSLGIALLSTIAGILGRLILHDKSEGRAPSDEAPIDEPTADGRTSREGNESRRVRYLVPKHEHLRNDSVFGGTEAGLHLLVRRLRAEIRDATNAFSHYNRVTMSQAEDTKRYADRMAREFNRKLEVDAQDAVARTADVHGTLVEQARATGDALEARIGEAVGALAAVLDLLSSASRVLSELPANVEQVRQSMDVLAGTAGTAATRIDDETGGFREARELLIRTANEQRTIMAQNMEFAGTLSTLMEQMTAAGRYLSELPANMEETRISVDSISEAVQTALTGLGDKSGELVKVSDSLVRSTREQRAIIEQSKELGSSFTNFTGQLGSASQRLVSLASQIERTRQVMDTFGGAAEDSEGTLHDRAREAAGACEALIAGAHAQQQVMARLLEGARALEDRMDSERSEWMQGFEEFRTVLGLVTQASGALTGLVEQLESTTRSLAVLSENVTRSAPAGPVANEGVDVSAANLREESVGSFSRRIGERIPLFKKKT